MPGTPAHFGRVPSFELLAIAIKGIGRGYKWYNVPSSKFEPIATESRVLFSTSSYFQMRSMALLTGHQRGLLSCWRVLLLEGRASREPRAFGRQRPVSSSMEGQQRASRIRSPSADL